MLKGNENVKGLMPWFLYTLVLLVCIIVFVTPSVPSQAAKLTNKSAKKVLKKIVKEVPCHYTFYDFDKDGIDEMVVLGFSEEFNEYDIKERSLTVYKVVNKKAKVIFRDYVTGDSTHPYIFFYIFDYKGNTYIQICKEQAGENPFLQPEDCSYTTYVYNNGAFDIYGKLEHDETGTRYYIGQDESTEDEYDDFMGDIYSSSIIIDMNWCTGELEKEYVQKVLMAEFERRCEQGMIDKDKVELFFSEDEDGLPLLIAKRSDDSRYEISIYDYNYYFPFLSSYNEYQGRAFSQPLYNFSNKGDKYLGTWVCDDYTLNISEYLDIFKVNIVQDTGKGKRYEWEYHVVFSDKGEAYGDYHSDFWGTKVRYKTNSKSGKTKSKLIYDDGFAFFEIENGILTWYDKKLLDETGNYKKGYGELNFVKQ